MASVTRTRTACNPGVAVLRRSRVERGLFLATVALLLWLLSAPRLHAQTLYEWREPGGALAYTQLPPRPQDGVLLQQIDLSALAPDERRAARRVMAHISAAHAAAPVSLHRADVRVSQALAALQGAELALQQGQAPRPGERRHLVNGFSRLAQPYFDRISGLEAAVTTARDALTAAYAARDGVPLRSLPR